MYRNRYNLENANPNFGYNLGIYSSNEKYLEDASTTQNNEISRSLKHFAMLTVEQEKQEPEQNMSHVDAVMRDFASNGKISHQQNPLTRKRFKEFMMSEGIYNTPTTEKKRRHYYTGSNKPAEKYHCVFCENNNEPDAVVKSHAVRDTLGRVLCPKLRTYICPICRASGDQAHTVKYCPQKPIITMDMAMKLEAYRIARNTYFRQRVKM